MHTGEQAAQFTRNSCFGAIAGVAAALGAFLSSIIIAHLLDVAQTGAVAFVQWLIMIVAAVTDLGAAAAIARFLPELAGRDLRRDGEELAAVLVRVPAAGGLACLLGFGACAGWLLLVEAASPETAIRWLLIGFSCALQTLSASAAGYLRGIQRFDRAALLTIFSACVQIAGISIGSLMFGVNGAISGYCLGTLPAAAFTITLLRWSARVPAGYGRRVIRYAFYACAGGLLAGFVWSRLELVFLQRFWGDEAVGLFAVALSLANLAAQGPMLLTAGLLPYFVENFGGRNFGAIQATYAAGTRALASLVLPMCCGMAAIMPVLLPLLYGPSFAPAVPAATVIVVSAGLGSIGYVGVHLLHGLERTDFLFFSGGLGAVLSVVVGLTLVPQFGVLGAAWGRLAVQATLVGAGFWFIARRAGCPPPWRELAKLTLSSLICAAAAKACLDTVTGLAALPVAVAAGAIGYVTALRLFKALSPSDLTRLRDLNGRLPARLRRAGDTLLALIAGPHAASAPVGAAMPTKSGEL